MCFGNLSPMASRISLYVFPTRPLAAANPPQIRDGLQIPDNDVLAQESLHLNDDHLFHIIQACPFPLFCGSNHSPPNLALNFSACSFSAKQKTLHHSLSRPTTECPREHKDSPSQK